MANLRCFSHKCCYTISCCLASFCLLLAPALFISGGITYSQDRGAKNIHEPNLCSVISSSYHESRCSGFRSTYRCFRPVWLVIHRIFEDDVVENRINATIEHDGFRSAADAEDKQNQYLVGMTYSCWYNIIDTSRARWDEPSIFIGMMLLIFGGVGTLVFIAGIIYHFRIRHKIGE